MCLYLEIVWINKTTTTSTKSLFQRVFFDKAALPTFAQWEEKGRKRRNDKDLNKLGHIAPVNIWISPGLHIRIWEEKRERERWYMERKMEPGHRKHRDVTYLVTLRMCLRSWYVCVYMYDGEISKQSLGRVCIYDDEYSVRSGVLESELLWWMLCSLLSGEFYISTWLRGAAVVTATPTTPTKVDTGTGLEAVAEAATTNHLDHTPDHLHQH